MTARRGRGGVLAAGEHTYRRTKLVEIDSADHGFAVPDPPRRSDPQTQSWQAFVSEAADWITRH